MQGQTQGQQPQSQKKKKTLAWLFLQNLPGILLFINWYFYHIQLIFFRDTQNPVAVQLTTHSTPAIPTH